MRPQPTAGALAFQALSRRHPNPLTQVVLAEMLATSQQNVQRWQAGTVRPTAIFRRKIRDLFQIPEDDWLTAAEHRFLTARGAGRTPAMRTVVRQEAP